MTKTELRAFRSALENAQTELGIGNRRNREALAIETSPDELDRVLHASDRDWAMNSLERNSSRLLEVQAALRRIDAGTFGICDGCEDNIDRKRLIAVPWALSCIVCQEAADRGQLTHRIEIDTSLVRVA